MGAAISPCKPLLRQAGGSRQRKPLDARRRRPRPKPGSSTLTTAGGHS